MKRTICRWLLNNFIPREMLSDCEKRRQKTILLNDENANLCKTIFEKFDNRDFDVFIDVMQIFKNTKQIQDINNE